MFNIGLKPRAFVCDQGTNNRVALNILGASIGSPKFLVDSMEIYAIFDPPHLPKSLRNNVMNKKLETFVDGRKIAWCDFIDYYEIDQRSNTTRAMLKITRDHVNPNSFQKMRVKLAAQVFSHSVSSVIFTCLATGQLNTPTAKYTSTFFNQVNNVFDCLNSKSAYDPNPYRCGLSLNRSRSLETLQYAQSFF